MPLRAWRDIFVRIYHNLGEDRVIAIAAGCTFFALLAIFPAIAALISIYGLFADPASITKVMESLSGVLPQGALDIIGGFMKTLTEKPRATLGTTFVISLALSLWSANSGVKALFDALNVVYHEKEKRSFFKLNAISLAFTLAAVVAGVVMITAIAIVPPALKHLPLGKVAETAIDLARWPVLLIIVAIGMAAIYRFGPSRETAKWQWLSWGGTFAAVMWLAASMLFSWYSARFGSYDQTYGSLGAVIVFMTWLWISSIVIMLGAELNAELEHQTARDTTTGSERPLGTRGAYVADTVGASH
jgi:membrane protein